MCSPDDRSADAPAHLVAAARAALASMADELGPMLEQELQRLLSARADWRSGAGAVALGMAAHDLHGLGALYGAPLTGRIAASLERLLAGRGGPAALVDAHVDAIVAVVREGAAGPLDPRGAALAAVLERAVARGDDRVLPQAA